MGKGKLIVIEGVDGSGKETQSNKLYKQLSDEGFKVMKISYPRYNNESSTLVKMYLRGEFGKNPDEISPYISSTFYAADRYASYKKECENFYTNGGIIIADRYTTSNMVHQAGKIRDEDERQKFLDWLWDFEFNLYGIPLPDVVFFLNIPVEFSIKLMEGRNNKITNEEEKDIHENNEEHLLNSYNNALMLIDKYHWLNIECVQENILRSVEDIHKEIYTKAIEIL